MDMRFYRILQIHCVFKYVLKRAVCVYQTWTAAGIAGSLISIVQNQWKLGFNILHHQEIVKLSFSLEHVSNTCVNAKSVFLVKVQL